MAYLSPIEMIDSEIKSDMCLRLMTVRVLINIVGALIIKDIIGAFPCL